MIAPTNAHGSVKNLKFGTLNRTSSYQHPNTLSSLMNIMTLLDCAFSFFANFPCRLSVSEMKFDLPCEEQFFASCHPFAELNFTPSRRLTTYEAFQSLFGPKPNSVPGQERKGNPLGLNPMDMFILIHRKPQLLLPYLPSLTLPSTLRIYPDSYNTFLIIYSPLTQCFGHFDSRRATNFILRFKPHSYQSGTISLALLMDRNPIQHSESCMG
jgi:hypothetical protein